MVKYFACGRFLFLFKEFFCSLSCSKASGFSYTNSLEISDAKNQTRACSLSVKYIQSILKLPQAAYYTFSEITKFVRHGGNRKNHNLISLYQLKLQYGNLVLSF